MRACGARSRTRVIIVSNAPATSAALRSPSTTPPASDYVAAGSFDDAAEAKRVAAALKPFGRTEIQRTELEGNDWYAVNVYPDGHGSIDDLLQAAWSHGAPDALVVRN